MASSGLSYLHAVKAPQHLFRSGRFCFALLGPPVCLVMNRALETMKVSIAIGIGFLDLGVSSGIILLAPGASLVDLGPACQ